MNDADRLTLDIASRFYLAPGSLDTAVRDELGISIVQFWQHVNRLLDDPAAALERPEQVQRLRRIRATRTRQRGRRVA